MSDSARFTKSGAAHVSPPPPPPLPPSRAISNRPGVLQRLVAPLGFGLTPRLPHAQGPQSSESRIHDVSARIHPFAPLLAQTVAHKTGIPIAAVDVSPHKTHAVLAGKEILKTVRIADRKITEDLNIRSAVISYASAHGSPEWESTASKRRDFLSATDVKWSHGEYDSIIATAANNGRLSIYDIKRPEVELLWLHEHTRQVHTLAFNPFQGALLLSGSHDGTVKYWDLRTSSREKSSLTLKSTKQFSGRAEAVRDLRWSPTDGVEFITCTDGGTIFKWDSRKTDRPELRINGHEKACYAIDWHPDGRHVVSGSADKNVRVWDFKNPDRRQKPCFQFRAPQAIMNIRWRPPSWTSTLHSRGDWQSTQLAVGYNADDPRVHIWDLRRPSIPFRELDRYNSPATSLLWFTKDLLWTVGNEGMFTQIDVQYSPQPPERISPCTMDWLATGEYAVFTEDRGRRSSIGSEAPSVGSRAAIHDELGTGEQVTSSRSITDDEGVHEHFLGPSYKFTHVNRGSVRSVRSTDNTPPSQDDQNSVLSLDKAIFDRASTIANRQIGVIGHTTRAAVDLPTVKFLAENYARPATEAERKQNPAKVLKNLEAAFKANGDVCDQISMHRLGQTWRILGAAILPELQGWFDQNRRRRLGQTVPGSPDPAVTAKYLIRESQGPPAEAAKNAPGFEGVRTAQGIKGDLFKEIIRNDWQKPTHEGESTSNMTTPLARPMPDVIPSTPIKPYRSCSSPNDALEGVPPLPPSIVAAHTAAAAASHALKSDVDKGPNTLSINDDLAPDRLQEIADFTGELSERYNKAQAATPQTVKRSKSDWAHSSAGGFESGERHRREQTKRAAPLEYKLQPRTILDLQASIEEPSRSRHPIAMARHDSMDSLQMFSESTTSGSSQKDKLDPSPGSPGASYENNQPSIASEIWRRLREYRDSSDPSSRDNDDDDDDAAAAGDGERRNQRRRPGFGSRQRSAGRNQSRSISPTQDGPFDFEQSAVTYAVQNARRSVSSRSPFPLVRPRLTDRPTAPPPPTADELQSPEYIYADFRPIDISSYCTNGHAKPWSALPLISQAIAFDLGLGENHAQFSAHLLMHIHPFFFHPKYRSSQACLQASAPPQTLADRLLQPHLSHRVIQSIFQQHHNFLKSLSLHIRAAELRNLCVEFDIPSVYRSRLAPDEDPDTASLNDGFSLSITCTNPTCSAPLNLSAGSSLDALHPTSCARCTTPRPPCPICLSLCAPDTQNHFSSATKIREDAAFPSSLWTFCQSCGHSAHMSCMQAWLRRPSTQGACPSAGCGHDCAPGELRRRRLADLAAAAAASASTAAGGEKQAIDVKGHSIAGEKRNGGRSADGGREKTVQPTTDLRRAPQSAAVERTRRLLRGSTSSSVGSESDREVSRAAAGVAGGLIGLGVGDAGFVGGRKVTRLVTAPVAEADGGARR